jgi:arylsulfatase A-like enzyme
MQRAPLDSIGLRPRSLQRPAALVVSAVMAVAPFSVVSVHGTSEASAVETRPNILLVNLDDATERMLDWRKPDGTYVMPNLQALKAQSTVFPNSIVADPSCCESRSATFTGRYPHNNGVLRQSDGGQLDTQHTFAHYLKQSGYATAMAGKFLTSWPATAAPPDWNRYSYIRGGYYNPVINRNGITSTYGGYSTNLLMDHLRDSLWAFKNANDAQPWLAMWSPQSPHIAGGYKTLATPETQYASVNMGNCTRPGELNNDRTDKPPYVSYAPPDPAYVQSLCTSQLRALISVDNQIAKMVTALRNLGEYDSTVIIVQSDNGYHWNENGWFSKFYPYEPSVNIPLYIRWPGHFNAGTDVRVASSLDVTATILDAANVTSDPGKPLDGDTLLLPGTRQTVFSEYFFDTANGYMSTWAMLRGNGWKYIETDHVNPSTGVHSLYKEYYNLVADPNEWSNILRDGNPANDPSAARLAELAAQLQAARTCSGTNCP